MRGKTFIISGPSGVGKSTVLSALLEKRKNLYFSVSATTRDPRPGELDGSFGLTGLIAKGYGTLAWVMFIVYVIPILTLGIYKISKAKKN